MPENQNPVFCDDTLSGDGTIFNPLSVISGAVFLKALARGIQVAGPIALPSATQTTLAVTAPIDLPAPSPGNAWFVAAFGLASIGVDATTNDVLMFLYSGHDDTGTLLNDSLFGLTTNTGPVISVVPATCLAVKALGVGALLAQQIALTAEVAPVASPQEATAIALFALFYQDVSPF